MKMQKVLLVEDAADMQLIVKAAIGDICDLTCVKTIEDAARVIRGGGFALVLLDVVLPDGDGFSFCKTLRASPTTKDLPIMFLTGEGEISQRVMGFDLGADDYITKPLEPNEFKARVMARLKKTGQDSPTTMSKHGFHIDFSIQKASLETPHGPKELNLTPIEFKLLVQFLRNEEKIFTREELLVVIWGTTVHVSGHTVDTHISSLRKKVGDLGKCFRAVVRQGYCFSPPGGGGL